MVEAAQNPVAQAGEAMGRGWAFGVNEGLDQLGALIGPLAIAGILAWRSNFNLAFASLAVPALITLALVFAIRLRFPDAGRIERVARPTELVGYPPAYWLYCASAGLVAFGFADFSLIAFRLSQAQVVPEAWIPVFYALSMGAGGLASLAVGRLFDRFGLIVLFRSSSSSRLTRRWPSSAVSRSP